MFSKIFKFIAILCLVGIHLGILYDTSSAQKKYDQIDFPELDEFNRPDVETFTLENGIKFFMVEDRELPLIKMRVKVKAGEIQVNDQNLGLSDIVGETMRSGGTESISSDSLNQLLENKAASMETGMGFNSGSASLNVLKKDFDTLLPIFIELLRNPAFPEEKIQLAQKQLKSQISRRNDDQGQIAQREFSRLIYGKQSVYGRLAQYATVNNIEREDVIGFHEQAFQGEDMMIGIVGDFDADSMKSMLSEAFQAYPAGEENQLDFPPVNYEYQSSVNFIHKSDVNQSLVRMGHIGGKRDNPDYATLQVLNNVLSGGFSGRILQKIRTELGLSYSPGGNFGMNVFYPGLFYVSVRTKSSSTAQVIEAVKDVIQNLQQDKISKKELEDAKNQFLNSLVFQYDSHEEVLRRQMDLDYKSLPPNTLERFVDSLKQVTRSDILQAARNYLKPEKMEILVVGNKNQMGDQLEQFGGVNEIDISIPEPGSQQKASSSSSGDRVEGKKWMDRMSQALLSDNSSLESIQTEGTATQYNSRLPGGQMTIDKSTVLHFPDEMKTELNTPQGKIVIELKEGKATREMGGKVQELPSSAAEEIKKGLRRNFLNIALHKDTLSVDYMGEETVRDSSYVKLNLTNLDPQLTLFVDPDTHLPYMSSYSKFSPQEGSQVTVKTYYEDWKTRQGVAYPFTQKSYRGGTQVSQTEVEKIKIMK